MDTKSDLTAALRGFIAQRSGIDSRNYFSNWRDASGVAAFRADYRRILKQGRHARELLRIVEQRESITVEDILLRSKGGRLEITEKDGCVSVLYCAGQYYAIEYRAAACAFLGWHHLATHWRRHCGGWQGGNRRCYPRACARAVWPEHCASLVLLKHSTP